MNEPITVEYVFEVFNNEDGQILRKASTNPRYIEDAIGRVDRHLPHWDSYCLEAFVDTIQVEEVRGQKNKGFTTDHMLESLADAEYQVERRVSEEEIEIEDLV